MSHQIVTHEFHVVFMQEGLKTNISLASIESIEFSNNGEEYDVVARTTHNDYTVTGVKHYEYDYLMLQWDKVKRAQITGKW